MAEETEVKNVGGDNGVASEVTLAKLVAAMEKIAAKTGADPKSQAAKAEKARTESISQGIKVSTKHRDAVKKNTDAVNLSTKAFKSLSGGLVKLTTMLSGAVFESLTGFTKELFGASRNLSNFVSHLPLIGGRLGQLTGLIDESYDTFQQLAKSGAAFDYSLTELRNTAASTRVSLNEFAGMVTENSEKLAMFGGTVDQGVKRIANLRDNMGSDLTERFERLGLTTEEINEALINQQYLTRAGARTETRNAREQALAAASLTENMLILSKLTGEDIKTQQDALAAEQQDFAFKKKMSKMDEDQQNAVQAALNETIAMYGKDSGAVQAFKAEFLGMPPLTEDAQMFTATFGEAVTEVQNLAGAVRRGTTVERLNEDRARRISTQSAAILEAGESLSGVLAAEAAGLEGLNIAGNFNSAVDLFAFVNEDGAFEIDKFLDALSTATETMNQDGVNDGGLSSMAEFRTALDNARTALTQNLVTPLLGVAADVLKPLIGSFKKFIGEDGASTVFQESLENLRVFLDNKVTPKIEDFFEAFAEDPKQAIKDAFSGISTAMTNWFLGDLEDGERSGGFYDKHLAPILKRLGTDLMQGAWSVITDGLTSLFTKPEVIAGTVTAIGLLFGASVVKTALANALSNTLLNRGGYGSGGGSGLGGKGKRFRIPKFLKGAGVLTALLGAAELASIRTDDTLTDDEKTQQTSESLGGTGGALTGLAAGALAGSFVPIVGTGIGGLIGGTLGYFGGSYAGGEIGERLTAPSNPSSNPPLSASDIRSEMIDPNDSDPLLAREARAQRARFADSMGNNSTNSASQSPTQDQSSAVINDLNTTMQELRQTLNDIKTNTKKQVEATENIGTV